jgi:predicted AAA+ superfamily ATPase
VNAAVGQVNRVIARRLAEFVDRGPEMDLYTRVLDGNNYQIMMVSGATGMGKTSLLLRMVHESAQRKLRKAEVTWTDTFVYDYTAVLRKLRDDLGLEHFGAFTDLINYYTDANYQPALMSVSM